MPAFGGGGGGASAADVWAYTTRALTDILGSDYTPARAALLSQISAARLAELDAANLPADIDTLLTRLTAGRAALLDEITAVRLAELNAANLPADIDTLLARLSAARSGYLDNLSAGAVAQASDYSATRAGYLDRLLLLAAGGAGELTAARAAKLDNLDAAVSSIAGAAGPVIATVTRESRLGPIYAFSPGSLAWPTANKAFFVPVYIPVADTLRRFFVLNGATASGNLDIGLYNSTLTRVKSTGSTAQSGINTIQIVDVADTAVAVGLYYLALVLDNTTGTIQRIGNVIDAVNRAYGCFQVASAFPLPAGPVTPAALDDDQNMHIFGFTTHASIP